MITIFFFSVIVAFFAFLVQGLYTDTMKKTSSQTLLLLDSNAIIHRAYHALPPLTTKEGKVVNAVYGFSMTLLSVIEKFHPTHIIASFDLSDPTFRHKAFEGYKAKRVKAPDDLYEQIPLVKEVVQAFGIPIYEKSGFEADDVIGSLAKLASKKGFNVIIVTGDADALQLVDENIRVFTMRRGIKDTVLFDREGVVEKYGFAPETLPDFKGLAGDTSDAIPGVSGIGSKTATTLLQKYTTLENIYDHLDEITPSSRLKLERDKEQAFQSKMLGTIRLDALDEFKEQEAQFVFSDAVRENVKKQFILFHFFSLVQRLSPKKEGEIFSKKGKKKGVTPKKYEKIYTKQKCLDFLETLKEDVVLVLDWKGVSIRIGSLLGIVFYTQETEGSVYVVLNEETREGIQNFLQKSSVRKIFFSLKEAKHLFLSCGFQFEGVVAGDVSLEAYVLQEGGDISFKRLAFSELGQEWEEVSVQEALFEINDAGKLSPKEESLCRKAEMVFAIHKNLQERIQKESAHQEDTKTLKDVLETIEIPLAPILVDMERNGIQFDKEIFTNVSEVVNKEIEELEKRIYDFAGREFNINSTKQLREILFDHLQIQTKNIKKTKTGYSTASAELQKLKKTYPIAEAIEMYRERFKLKTTYIETLPKLVEEDGRIRTTFQQTITATGRLSSTDPNLQNIPIKSTLGRLLRKAFVAKEGTILVSADYSQIDLRCAAHVSEDAKMIEAFHKGKDIHTITASEVFGVAQEEVTKSMRRRAKVLNFGVLYGMGIFGFMNASGVSREEAQTFIDSYMHTFSGLAQYIEKIKKDTKETGYVETELGRRRYIPEIQSSNFQVVSSGERMAVNLPIQGLASDIMKLAMIACEKEFFSQKEHSKLVLQIHDELIFEIPETLEEMFSQKVKYIMENVYTLHVPLTVDISSGKNWGEL